jgi:hypothetical protein
MSNYLHGLVDQRGGYYRKTALVKAVKMHHAFRVETLEGVMEGKKGDYLCKGPAGELWPVDAEIFEQTYELQG